MVVYYIHFFIMVTMIDFMAMEFDDYFLIYIYMIYLDTHTYGYDDVLMGYFFNIFMCYLMDDGLRIIFNFNVVYLVDRISM